jgi:hypothetical protein
VSAPAARVDDTVWTYSHTPKPVGHPISFRLEGDRLVVDSGRRVDTVALGAVEEVRLTYAPGRLGRSALATTVRLTDGKTFSFSSVTFASMVEMRVQGPEYRAFLAALLHAIGQASPRARYVAGQPLWRWLISAALAVGLLFGLVLVAWRAFQTGAAGTALLALAVGGLGLWQLEPMVRLNRPRPFAFDSPPPELLP